MGPQVEIRPNSKLKLRIKKAGKKQPHIETETGTLLKTEKAPGAAR